MKQQVALVVMVVGASSAAAWDDTRGIVAPQPSCAAGVQCQVTVTPGFMAGQVSLDFTARTPALAGRGVSLRVLSAAAAVVAERSGGVAADGRLNMLIGNGQSLEPGRYRYVIAGVAEGQFTVTSGAKAAAVTPPPAAAAQTASAGSLVGIWYGIAGTPGTLELRTDGTYWLNGRSGGRYRMSGREVVFDGAVTAWNKGRATLKDGTLEFQWKSAEGFNNWFVYQRGK